MHRILSQAHWNGKKIMFSFLGISFSKKCRQMFCVKILYVRIIFILIVKSRQIVIVSNAEWKQVRAFRKTKMQHFVVLSHPCTTYKCSQFPWSYAIVHHTELHKDAFWQNLVCWQFRNTERNKCLLSSFSKHQIKLEIQNWSILGTILVTNLGQFG